MAQRSQHSLLAESSATKPLRFITWVLSALVTQLGDGNSGLEARVSSQAPKQIPSFSFSPSSLPLPCIETGRRQESLSHYKLGAHHQTP